VRIRPEGYAPADARAIWREIEIAANQTLGDLGDAIPLAFDFWDPHLWSFFLSGKAWDRTTEYALSSKQDLFGGGRPRAARRVRIRDVPFPGSTGKKEFLFLFDYGDEWHFGVKLVRTSDSIEPGAAYPRVVASQGESPPQYPDSDEDWDEDEEKNGEAGGGGDPESPPQHSSPSNSAH
ncbi:MAG: plasmid pRiA4b ORF-3 family protein, partial [Chloroflexi bacterium]|nr:plasmid pRiA4b ORF-3 family protein [Chloroflexota bacterium]